MKCPGGCELIMQADVYDVIVVGAGHAGCEAALAAARMGCATLMVTMNMDLVAQMPCNPSIGGPGKGHLVREIDALGGEMGQATDRNFIQIRLLNGSKGPAVQALRSQADKRRYSLQMKHALENTPNLTLIQGMVVRLTADASGGRVTGVVTHLGREYRAKAVVITSGTFLNGRILSGEHVFDAGRAGEFPAHGLSACLAELGLQIARLTTNTPPRVDARTVDFSATEQQPGSDTPLYFSFQAEDPAYRDDCARRLPGFLNPVYPIEHSTSWRPQLPCYLVHSTEETYRVVKENLHRSPIVSGFIEATGPRYCPSFEEKVVHFPHHVTHQLFLEPEGWETSEVYVQGLFTGMPEEVQLEMLHSIPALRQARIMRPGYAIEYDHVPPYQIRPSLETKVVAGLFLGGQINGTSGYEEAAAQGLMAGINAARYAQDRAPVILGRDQAYIGVLIDDLVTKDLDEPYRIMTSRAEYRLLLRQDNADLRLSPIGHEIGLLPTARYERMKRKDEAIRETLARLGSTWLRPTAETNDTLAAFGLSPISDGVNGLQLLRRPEAHFDLLAALVPSLSSAAEPVCEQVEIEAKYAGYIDKQREQVEKFRRVEARHIPADFDFMGVSGIRLEAREKLTRHQPATLGQASRLSGVNPADLSVLLVHLERHG
jgi:tRNA uridine 5-carboxymethylaminomethyl modification enzyme